ncbi:MAG: TIR domain-containing protein [Bacteroidota bacterium]
MSNPIKVFISYSHRDEDYKDELNKRLKPYQSRNIIEVWDDRDLILGQNWHKEINKSLKAANVILYLVSPDFMASDYINDVELSQVMDRHLKGEQALVPIIIRPSDLSMLRISKFQATPKNAKAISTWDNTDEAWLDVTTSLSKLFTAIKDGDIELGGTDEDFSTTPEDRPSPEQAQHDLNSVKQLIAGDMLDEAIKELLVITTDEKYAFHNNTIIGASARLAGLKRGISNFTISRDDAERTRSQIRQALLSTLEDMQR